MEERVSYALAALDMDGTLLNSNHETTAYTRAVLQRVAAAGKVLALSTGRAHSELARHLAENPSIEYVIGENGARVYNARSGEVIRCVNLDDGDLDFFLTEAARFDTVLQVFLEGQSWMQGALDESLQNYRILEFLDAFLTGSRTVEDMRALCHSKPGCAGKLNIYFRSLEDRAAYCERIKDRPVVLSVSIGYGIEISPAGATKASGLQALCDHLGIPIERSMALGDAGNDVEIMQAAGLSVAMSNAIESVRALAQVVTEEDCDHDGAAKAIERYMLDV